MGARALSSGTEWFPSVHPIKFAGPDSKDPLSFKHYNSSQVVMGKVSTVGGQGTLTAARPPGGATIARRVLAGPIRR